MSRGIKRQTQRVFLGYFLLFKNTVLNIVFFLLWPSIQSWREGLSRLKILPPMKSNRSAAECLKHVPKPESIFIIAAIPKFRGLCLGLRRLIASMMTFYDWPTVSAFINRCRRNRPVRGADALKAAISDRISMRVHMDAPIVTGDLIFENKHKNYKKTLDIN